MGELVHSVGTPAGARSTVSVTGGGSRPHDPALSGGLGIAAGLAHDALPCPATGLEFVLYDRETLAGLGTGASFALNLNTGRELPPLRQTDPGDGPRFWYAIDRDIIHQQGRVLTGPAFGTLCRRLPYGILLPVVTESVMAHLEKVGELGDNAVLNGCRALRFHAERWWSAKPVAAAWALEHAPTFRAVITAAVDSHHRDRAAGRRVAGEEAKAFLRYVVRQLQT